MYVHMYMIRNMHCECKYDVGMGIHICVGVHLEYFAFKTHSQMGILIGEYGQGG